MTKPNRKITAALLTAAGLSSLSPVQQGAALITAGAAMLWASPALATNNIPGVGTIVKKNPGGGCITAPSDANGEVRLTGLEPGTYDVQVFGGKEVSTMRVGRDGRLGFVVFGDTKRAQPGTVNGQRMPSDPVVRRWAEPIAFDGAKPGAVTLDARSLDNAGMTERRKLEPIEPPRDDRINVNTSTESEMVRLAPTLTPEAARLIVAERAKSGAFKDAQDFASRVCTKAEVNFDDASLKMGDTTIVMKKGVDPKSPGWRCKTGDNMIRLFNSWLSHTGKSALLK